MNYIIHYKWNSLHIYESFPLGFDMNCRVPNSNHRILTMSIPFFCTCIFLSHLESFRYLICVPLLIKNGKKEEAILKTVVIKNVSYTWCVFYGICLARKPSLTVTFKPLVPINAYAHGDFDFNYTVGYSFKYNSGTCSQT